MTPSNTDRGQAQTFALLGFGLTLIIGGLLFMMMNDPMTQLLTMGDQVTNNADSTQAISYTRQAWQAFPLIVIALGLFSLLVGAVYSSDVRRGGI